jgi:signal peptidase II
MNVLVSALVVVAVDHTLKTTLRQRLHQPFTLGRFASIRVVSQSLWLARARPRLSATELWLLLLLAVVPLYVFSTLIPGAESFAGLAIGGAISNGVEHWRRGKVTDYIDLSFWPAFNVADAAIAVGVAGLVVTTWNVMS